MSAFLIGLGSFVLLLAAFGGIAAARDKSVSAERMGERLGTCLAAGSAAICLIVASFIGRWLA